jgi:hypothetical protein
MCPAEGRAFHDVEATESARQTRQRGRSAERRNSCQFSVPERVEVALEKMRFVAPIQVGQHLPELRDIAQPKLDRLKEALEAGQERDVVVHVDRRFQDGHERFDFGVERTGLAPEPVEQKRIRLSTRRGSRIRVSRSLPAP